MLVDLKQRWAVVARNGVWFVVHAEGRAIEVFECFDEGLAHHLVRLHNVWLILTEAGTPPTPSKAEGPGA